MFALPARLQVLDDRLAVRSNRLCRYHRLRDFLRGVSRLGDGVAWYTLLLGLWWLQGGAALPLVRHFVISGVLGVVIYKLLKRHTLRPRPYEVVTDVVCAGAPLDKFSFPSGHTLHAVSFTWQAVHFAPDLGFVLVPLAAMIAASRVVLGLHYPTDVLVGAGLGAGFGAAGAWLA